MMRASTIASLLPVLVASVNAQSKAPGLPVTGALGNATVIQNNPPGVVYSAVLPAEAWAEKLYPTGGNVVGSVTATATKNGIGVVFQVKFKNLPKDVANLGPYMYHVHTSPVPADGNCSKTLGHLDPFLRGEAPVCDHFLPQTCQVGDMSSKWGNITEDSYEKTFTDLWASTVEGIGSFIGNRSLVIHTHNKTRITCANFTLAPSFTPPTVKPSSDSSKCPTRSSDWQALTGT